MGRSRSRSRPRPLPGDWIRRAIDSRAWDCGYLPLARQMLLVGKRHGRPVRRSRPASMLLSSAAISDSEVVDGPNTGPAAHEELPTPAPTHRKRLPHVSLSPRLIPIPRVR